VTNGAGRSGQRAGSDTGWFTGRRLRSAFSSWRVSIRPADILVAVVLAALALGLAAYLLLRSEEAVHLAFTERAQRLQAAVTEKLVLPQENLNALSSFLEASGHITRRQFRLVTFPMIVRHKFVYAFEWLPLVRDSERADFESAARAAGQPDYRFWELGPDDKPREAGRRDTYVPVHYMEPPGALALGFDIATNPLRWATAEKARDSGAIAASPPFTLIEESRKSDAVPVVAIYAPVYREGDPALDSARRVALSGFAMAIFRVAPVVDSVASAVDAAGLGLILRDPEGAESPLLAQRPGNAMALPRRAGFDLEFPVPFADRRWALTAAAGLLAAFLVFATVTSLRTITRLRRQVEKVGPYRLVARLGNGAMGVVWEARHALLRRPTAIKLLAPGTEGAHSLARFEREVQLTAGLTHPSTIAIYDYGRTADRVFYYAMELLNGINLLQLVELDGPVPPARVVHFLRQACGALAEAHAAGLIHRDIKPANMMICVYGGIPDFLKILDFGLVKDVGVVEPARQSDAPQDSDDAGLSRDGSLLGTPLYMAPEGMSDPSHVDARADLFALGAVGYFLLTGKSPFPGRTAIEVFRMERQGPPTPLSTASRHPVPAALAETLGRCLSFLREDRPASAEALDAMLEASAVSPAWTVEQGRAWWKQHGAAALMAARAQRVERNEVMVVSDGDRVER
jgi:serine/threonine-protein kinase